MGLLIVSDTANSKTLDLYRFDPHIGSYRIISGENKEECNEALAIVTNRLKEL